MRKNIFSWKSVAGLALLFGLTTGITSCEQVTLPDDSTNSGTEKPVEPSTGVNGADIVITAATIEQVNDSLNLDKTTKEGKKLYPGSLREELDDLLDDFVNEDLEEITITIESAGIEMTKNSTLKLPFASGGNYDKLVVNLIFTNTFKKSEGVLTITDEQHLGKLNITLPDGDFGQLKINADYSTVTIDSDGETDVEISANMKQSASSLTLGDGLNVVATQDISGKGEVKTDGATVVALVADGAVSDIEKSGVKLSIKKGSSNVYVKEVIARGSIALSAKANEAVEDSPLEKVTIKNGKTVTLNTAVEEIVGELKDGKRGNTTAKIGVNKYFAVVKSVSNAKVSGSGELGISTTDFDNVEFDGFSPYNIAKEIDTVEDLKFNTSVIKINVPAQADADSYTFTFDGVTFGNGTTFDVAKYNNTFKRQEDGKDVAVDTWYYLTKQNLSTSDYKCIKNDSILTSQIIDLDKYKPAYVTEVKKNLTESYVEKDGNKIYGKGILTKYMMKLNEVKDKNDTIALYFFDDVEVEEVTPTADELTKSKITNGTKVQVKAKLYDVNSKLIGKKTSYDALPTWIQRNNYSDGTVWKKVTENVVGSTDYANFTLTFAFDGCKIDKKDLSKQNMTVAPVTMPKDEKGNEVKIKVRYDIDGTLYEADTTDKTGSWTLVKVDE